MKEHLQHPLKRFALLFIGSYLLLYLLGQMGLATAYGKYFRTIGEATFNGMKGGIGIVKFTESEGAYGDEYTSTILLANKKQVQAAANKGTNVEVRKNFVNHHRIGFFPLLILFSLILASPVPWKRKLILLVVAFGIMTLFTLFRQWLLILNDFHKNYETLQVLQFSSFWADFLHNARQLMVFNIVISGMVATFLWGILTFRKADIQRISKELGF